MFLLCSIAFAEIQLFSICVWKQQKLGKLPFDNEMLDILVRCLTLHCQMGGPSEMFDTSLSNGGFSMIFVVFQTQMENSLNLGISLMLWNML